MRTLLCLFLGTGLLASAGLAANKAPEKKKQQTEAMSQDMREAIAFERAKDRADARQAAIEARHPTIFYNRAERSGEENSTPGRKVPDPGPKK